MKKNSFLMFLSWMGVLITAPVHAESALLLVTSDFPPYVFCEKDAKSEIEVASKGIDIDILSELFRRIGQAYSLQCLSRKRAVEMIKSGEAAGVFPGFKTPEREAFAIFLDEPLQLSQYSLFVKRGGEFPFATLDDLAGKTIGIERGHNVSLAFHAAANAGKFRVEEASAPEQSLKKLLAGRIDAYSNNYNVVRYMAKQLGVKDQITALPNPLTQGNPSYLMISKAAEIPGKSQLIQRLNQSLHEMWRDGTVERLTEGYLQ